MKTLKINGNKMTYGQAAIYFDVTAVTVHNAKNRLVDDEKVIAWGEKRNEAMGLIELTCQKHPDIQTAEELVPLVYRVKQGIEA